MQIVLISSHSKMLQCASALATACHAAASGLRVLLVSVGPTHMLGELLQQELGPRPKELDQNLAAMELVALDEIGQRWDTLRQGGRGGMPSNVRDVKSDELPTFSGMDLIALEMVADRAQQSGRFDLAIFDGPSTDSLLGEVIVSDMLRWLVRMIFGLDRGPGKSRKSQEMALLPTSLIPANTIGIGLLQDLRTALDRTRDRVLDSTSGTRVRLAVHAEELALTSVRQAMNGLGLFGFHVDMVLACGAADELDADTKTMFEPWLTLSPMTLSPTNQQGWAERGKALYANHSQGLSINPTETSQAIKPLEERREVTLHIPFLKPDALDILLSNEEIIVRLDQFRRNLLLPGIVEGGKLRAKVEGKTLRLWMS
ncbi:MAG: ATPase [Chloroflexaceae bacterium]|nr:ATPase [Chloroflexaceae bacterium]